MVPQWLHCGIIFDFSCKLVWNIITNHFDVLLRNVRSSSMRLASLSLQAGWPPGVPGGNPVYTAVAARKPFSSIDLECAVLDGHA